MAEQTATGTGLSTTLALDRTRLAHERTLMAWVRTATSLISFGFTIYKFFQLRIEQEAVHPTGRLIGPREFALVMIITGIVALLLATLQHVIAMRELRPLYAKRMPLSTASVVAGLISFLGVAALVGVLFRE